MPEKSNNHVPIKFSWQKALIQHANPSRYGATQIAILLVVALHWNSGKDPVCWASVKTLARESRADRTTVMKTLALAVADGWLQKKERDGTSHEYRPSVPIELELDEDFPSFSEKKSDQLTATDLVAYFDFRVMKTRHEELGWAAAGPTNEKALRSQFARWMREDGLRPTLIAAMIELFVMDPRRRREGRPLWKTFIDSRQELIDAAMKSGAAAYGHSSFLAAAGKFVKDEDDGNLGWANFGRPQ